MLDQTPSSPSATDIDGRIDRTLRLSMSLVLLGGVLEAALIAYLIGIASQLSNVGAVTSDALATAGTAVLATSHALVKSDAFVVLPALLAVVIALYIATVIASNGGAISPTRNLQGVRLAEFLGATSVAVLTLCVMGAVGYPAESGHLLGIVILTLATVLAGIAVSAAVRGAPEQRMLAAQSRIDLLEKRRSSLPAVGNDARRPAVVLATVFIMLVLAWYAWGWLGREKAPGDQLPALLASGELALWVFLGASVPVLASFTLGNVAKPLWRRRVWMIVGQVFALGILVAAAWSSPTLGLWPSVFCTLIAGAAAVSAHSPVIPSLRYGRFARFQLGPAITALIRGRLVAAARQWQSEFESAARDLQATRQVAAAASDPADVPLAGRRRFRGLRWPGR